MILRRDAAPQSQGRLVLANQEQPDTGVVVAVGPGIHYKDRFIPTELQVGERVRFQKYTGQMMDMDGEQYLVMREGDVIGVVEEIPQAAREFQEAVASLLRAA